MVMLMLRLRRGPRGGVAASDGLRLRLHSRPSKYQPDAVPWPLPLPSPCVVDELRRSSLRALIRCPCAVRAQHQGAEAQSAAVARKAHSSLVVGARWTSALSISGDQNGPGKSPAAPEHPAFFQPVYCQKELGPKNKAIVKTIFGSFLILRLSERLSQR